MKTAATVLEDRQLGLEFDRPWSEEVVSVDSLRVDHTYQRDPKVSLINSIAAAYDLALAGYIVVNRRASGALYVIDGQQRYLGAKKAGEPEVLARVFNGLDRKTEAQYYDRLNDTKPQQVHERFKAALVAGDPATTRIYAIVHSFGSSVYGVDGTGDDAIAAVGTLRWIYDQGGELGLSRTLSVIRRAFDDLTRATTNMGFLKSVFYVVDRHERIDDGRLARRIQATGLIALKQRALGITARSADATGYYIAVLDTYNYKLPASKRETPVFRRAERAE